MERFLPEAGEGGGGISIYCELERVYLGEDGEALGKDGYDGCTTL